MSNESWVLFVTEVCVCVRARVCVCVCVCAWTERVIIASHRLSSLLNKFDRNTAV